MRRVLVAASALLLSCVVGVVCWRLGEMPVPAVRLAPAEAEIFVECPNLPRSAERWSGTALAQILNEPSVQRFLGRPWKALPKGYRAIWDGALRFRPTSVFFASTDVARRHWLLGLRCAGDLKHWPHEAETLTSGFFGGRFHQLDPRAAQPEPAVAREFGGTEVYGTRCGNWLLFSSDAATVAEAARRRDLPQAGLETDPVYAACVKTMPAHPDVVTFARGSMAGAMGLPASGVAGAAPRALVVTTSLVGREIRDRVFALRDDPGDESAGVLSRVSLEATSAKTLFYGSTRLVPSAWRRAAAAAGGRFAMAQTFEEYFVALQNAGIDVAELDEALDNLEMIVERDPVTDVLQPVIALETRDLAKTQTLLKRLVDGRFATRTKPAEVEGSPVYLISLGTPARPITLAIGFVGRQLLLAGNPETYAEAIRRLRVHQVGLDRSEQYRAASASVVTPTEAYAYLDTKPAFEKLYASLRPMAILGTAFVPTLTHYVDPFTLPETAEVSRHLTPIVFSRHRVKDGTVDESAGPITAYQAVALGIGVGVALGFVPSPASP